MTDGTIIAIVGSVLATMQTISTAWLNRVMTKNACGGEKCQQIMATKLAEAKEPHQT